MHLHNALTQIAERFDLDAAALIEYADADLHTGWDKGAGDWPTGSLWRVEGQVLYALVRALQPETVLELGTWYGCSATHILEAMDANGRGTLYAVDNHIQGNGALRIPERLMGRFEPVNQDISGYFAHQTPAFDLIFEDGMHDPAQVETAWREGTQRLNPGGVMLSHDAMHYLVGADVRKGIEAAAITDALYIAIEPSDCGLAVWRKPGTALVDYSAWTVAQLRDELKQRGITASSRKKADLIEALTA